MVVKNEDEGLHFLFFRPETGIHSLSIQTIRFTLFNRFLLKIIMQKEFAKKHHQNQLIGRYKATVFFKIR
jgi:hypothetical protein